jgi:two-component system, cell cycle response regulator
MALRVLLADESPTIKKVFQLSLQDYAVEVTTVQLGVDVLQVAKKTNPDIVFADVLLQKKNGYDVCAELKGSPEFQKVPVVLIWSGFMELDRKKFLACKADGDLEKPFDTERLRELVKKLVPKTTTSPLSDFLTFPALPEFDLQPPADLDAGTPSSSPASVALPAATTDSEDLLSEDWSMESFAPPPEPPPQVPEAEDGEDSEWVAKTLTQFKMDRKKVMEEPSVTFNIPEEKIDADTIIGNRTSPSIKAPAPKSAPAVKPAPPPPPLPLPLKVQTQVKNAEVSAPVEDEDELELDVPIAKAKPEARPSAALSDRQLEAIVRAEARQLIEQMLWEIVPDIATQILEREIRKIIKENDGTP